MGTRSLTHIVEDSETLTTIYRQMDGYLRGHGLDLASFLADKKIVNGLSGDTTNVANGMGCLSAQIIAHLKEQPGNIYLYPPNSKDCWEEFTYFIYYKEKQIKIKVKNYSNAVIFDGTPTELLKKVKNES
jgi:hypothetical protein